MGTEHFRPKEQRVHSLCLVTSRKIHTFVTTVLFPLALGGICLQTEKETATERGWQYVFLLPQVTTFIGKK
jgi:hypothetical protein